MRKVIDEKAIAFGNKHGFPVIFVMCHALETNGSKTEAKGSFKFFKGNQMHEAADFAQKNLGTLGVFDPNGFSKNKDKVDK